MVLSIPPSEQLRNAYRDKGEYDRAIEDYNQAIQLDNDYALAYNNRGYAYEKKGNYDQAIADYDRTLAIDPNFEFARNGRDRAIQLRDNP